MLIGGSCGNRPCAPGSVLPSCSWAWHHTRLCPACCRPSDDAATWSGDEAISTCGAATWTCDEATWTCGGVTRTCDEATWTCGEAIWTCGGATWTCDGANARGSCDQENASAHDHRATWPQSQRNDRGLPYEPMRGHGNAGQQTYSKMIFLEEPWLCEKRKKNFTSYPEKNLVVCRQ